MSEFELAYVNMDKTRWEKERDREVRSRMMIGQTIKVMDVMESIRHAQSEATKSAFNIQEQLDD